MIEDLIKYNKDADSKQIADTVIYKYLFEKQDTHYCSSFKRIESDISSILTRIPAMFSNYTNHDITHSLRIADYMVSLLPGHIEEYSHTELAIMLISAIFHDVGMSVSETEAALDISKQDEIRKTHHIRSEKFVLEKASIDYFKINTSNDVNFKKIVSLIVRAHGEDFSWIEKNIKDDEEYGTDSVNPLFITCLLRLSDFLDFDSRRTPLCLFKYLQLRAFSYDEWRKHFPITNYRKINHERQIYFKGHCEEPEVYHQISKYFEEIEKEIKKEKLLLFESDEKYKLDISDNILDKLEPTKFSSVNLQFNMDYVAITNLLMGENLYADKTVVIRELLQNSIDACLLKKELSAKKSEKYTPEIRIIIDSNKISICDNEIGMSKKIIENYFLCIGKSYYTSEAFKNTGASFNPISHYGIGFLSCFLLTNNIEITTIPFEDNKLKYHFIVNKDDRNVEILTYDQQATGSGTSVSFINNKSDEVFRTAEEIIKYIENLFLDFPVPISVYDKDSYIKTIQIKTVDTNKRIDISKYLNNVQCSFSTMFSKEFCRINNVYNPFSFFDNNYLYDPLHLPEIILDSTDFYNYRQNTAESYDITNIVLPNNKIYILRIYPLDFESENYYDSFFDYNDDIEMSYERTFNKFPQETITILLFESEIINQFDDIGKIDLLDRASKDEKYKHFLSEIEKLLAKLNYETDSFLYKIETKQIFYNENFYSYITDNKQIKSEEKNDLAFHNIRIGQYRIILPSLLDSFMPFHWYINVNTNNIFPNISRDSISSKISAELGYAIGYAYNKYLCDMETDISKKEFINQFIKKFYPEIDTNIFIKK